MKIICKNCGTEFEFSELYPSNMTNCPKCGAPISENWIGLKWVK